MSKTEDLLYTAIDLRNKPDAARYWERFDAGTRGVGKLGQSVFIPQNWRINWNRERFDDIQIFLDNEACKYPNKEYPDVTFELDAAPIYESRLRRGELKRRVGRRRELLMRKGIFVWVV